MEDTILARMKVDLVLLHNLVARMDYNERQDTWKLTGSVTKDEYHAIKYAIDTYSVQATKREAE